MKTRFCRFRLIDLKSDCFHSIFYLTTRAKVVFDVRQFVIDFDSICKLFCSFCHIWNKNFNIKKKIDIRIQMNFCWTYENKCEIKFRAYCRTAWKTLTRTLFSLTGLYLLSIWKQWRCKFKLIDYERLLYWSLLHVS